jgi:hypothetical protein
VNDYAETEPRTATALHKAGLCAMPWIMTVQELIALSDRSNEGLLEIKGFGYGALLDVARALEICGAITDALEWSEYKYWKTADKKRFGHMVEEILAIRESEKLKSN